MRMTNHELRMTNLKSALRRFLVILAALCVLAGNFFAQSPDIAREETDLLPFTAIFQNSINPASVERKRNALLQLRNFQTAAASRIALAALKDSSEIVRATAAASVVYLPPDEAARNLIALLADKKPLVRREAAFNLGIVGNSLAINPLLRTLQKDKVLEVRNAAIGALGAIGDAAAVPELVRILQRRPRAKDEFARRAAARSVGQIAQIIQTGNRKIVTPENFLPERFKSNELPKHPNLAEAFPQFRPAVGALIAALQNPKEFPDVKREAAFALGAVGDAAAIPILQSSANGEDYYLSEICREALRKIARSEPPA